MAADAEGGAYGDLVGFELERPAYCRQQFRAPGTDPISAVDALRKNEKIRPGVAGDEGFAEVGGNAPGEGLHQEIPGGGAEALIDDVEIVEVQQRHGEGAMGVADADQGLVEGF